MRDLVQVLNPKTDRHTLIDRANAKILRHKRTAGPYKNVPIATREGVMPPEPPRPGGDDPQFSPPSGRGVS